MGRGSREGADLPTGAVGVCFQRGLWGTQAKRAGVLGRRGVYSLSTFVWGGW